MRLEYSIGTELKIKMDIQMAVTVKVRSRVCASNGWYQWRLFLMKISMYVSHIPEDKYLYLIHSCESFLDACSCPHGKISPPHERIDMMHGHDPCAPFKTSDDVERKPKKPSII
jgi:hypothetical protein